MRYLVYGAAYLAWFAMGFGTLWLFEKKRPHVQYNMLGSVAAIVLWPIMWLNLFLEAYEEWMAGDTCAACMGCENCMAPAGPVNKEDTH